MTLLRLGSASLMWAWVSMIACIRSSSFICNGTLVGQDDAIGCSGVMLGDKEV